MDFPIYLDYCSTTPVDPRVLNEMLPFFTQNFGNTASKTHQFGETGAKAVARARAEIATAIKCNPKEIIFTSGATESINLALKGAVESYSRKKNHIITTKTEHKAVLDTCRKLEIAGKRVSYISVNSNGIINLKELEDTITKDTVLVCVMLANNETGVIQPLKEVSAIAHKHGAICMTDASQALGKIPVDVNKLGLDLISMSAHKLYGPKGVGALYVRSKNPRVRLNSQIEGGGHERGMRSGTLNVPGIVGFGKAVLICEEEMRKEYIRLQSLRDRIEEKLRMALNNVRVNGDKEHRLPHVSNLSFREVNARELISKMENIAVATGSACTSASIEPSHVLEAMGMAESLILSSIRISLGRFTTTEEINFVIKYLTESVASYMKENLN